MKIKFRSKCCVLIHLRDIRLCSYIFKILNLFFELRYNILRRNYYLRINNISSFLDENEVNKFINDMRKMIKKKCNVIVTDNFKLFGIRKNTRISHQTLQRHDYHNYIPMYTGVYPKIFLNLLNDFEYFIKTKELKINENNQK